MQGQQRTCCICKESFISHPKAGERQKTCLKPECRRIHKANNNAQWRLKNPIHIKDDYARIKLCLENNPGYLNRYRQSHPKYVQKNRDSQRLRDRIRKLNLDIQAKLMQQTEIINLLEDHPTSSRLDIQVKLDFTIPLLNNTPIKKRGDDY